MRGPDKEEKLLLSLGQVTLDERDGTRVHALRGRPGTYVIAVFGKLGQGNVGHSIAAIYRDGMMWIELPKK